MSQGNAIDISQISFPEVMDLRTAALFLELSEMRVRTLAREEQLKGTKDEDGKWAFKKADLTAFKSTPRPRGGGGGPRGEGKAWIIRVPYKKLEAVKADLAKHDIKLEPRYNYAKQKEYRAKRAAKEKAKAVKSSGPQTGGGPTVSRPS